MVRAASEAEHHVLGRVIDTDKVARHVAELGVRPATSDKVVVGQLQVVVHDSTVAPERCDLLELRTLSADPILQELFAHLEVTEHITVCSGSPLHPMAKFLMFLRIMDLHHHYNIIINISIISDIINNK